MLLVVVTVDGDGPPHLDRPQPADQIRQTVHHQAAGRALNEVEHSRRRPTDVTQRARFRVMWEMGARLIPFVGDTSFSAARSATTGGCSRDR